MKTYKIITLALFAYSNLASADTNTVYRDAKHGFSFHYPANWIREETTFGSTKIKVINKAKDLECLVNVQALQAGDTDDPNKIATLTFANTLAKSLAAQLPNSRIISAKPSTISNQGAVEVIIEFAISSSAVSVPVTNTQYMTVKKPFAYNVGCKSLGKYSATNLKLIYKILSGFVLHPKQNFE